MTSLVAMLGLVSICHVCVCSMRKIVTRDLYFILLPEFWFYLLIFLYFGFGTAAVFFISEASEYGRLIATVYRVMPSDVNLLNALIQFSLIFQITVGFLIARIIPNFKQNTREASPPKVVGTWYGIFLVIWIFLVMFESSVGGIAKELTHYISYAFLFHLTRVMLISKYRPFALVQLFIFLVFEIRFGFLIASKLYMIMPLLVILLGYVSVRGLGVKALPTGGVLIIIFSLLVPLTEGMRQGSEVKIERNVQTYVGGFLLYSFYRLSHLPVAAYLINDESGKYSTVNDWYTVLIPRIIYPEKPNISFRGNELSRDLYGFDSTSTARTIFVDAFVSAGWSGLIFINCLLFLVFFLGRHMTFRYALNGQFSYLPLIFMNLFIIMQIEGVVSTSVIAPLCALCILFFLVKLANVASQKK